jgi:hypothetical protein
VAPAAVHQVEVWHGLFTPAAPTEAPARLAGCFAALQALSRLRPSGWRLFGMLARPNRDRQGPSLGSGTLDFQSQSTFFDARSRFHARGAGQPLAGLLRPPAGVVSTLMGNLWFRTCFKAWSLGLEASSVIALRTSKMTTDGAAAHKEARQMISEKFEAGLALWLLALTGGLGLTPYTAAAKTLAHYGRRVRANRRRLSQG